MSASVEDADDDMRHKANARGMIVMQPSAPRDQANCVDDAQGALASAGTSCHAMLTMLSMGAGITGGAANACDIDLHVLSDDIPLGSDFKYLCPETCSYTCPADSGPPSWKPLYHHQQIILFLRHAVDVFQANRRAIHVTGYSQGG